MTIPRDPGAAALRLGFVPGVTLRKWRTIWAERFPRAPLDVIEVAEAEQRLVLLADTVDMCFVRLPVDRDGLHVIPLYDEVPVVWLSKDHPLAELDEVTGADLADERILNDADPASIELATYSAAVLRVPMSIARSHSRRDLVYRPVIDAPVTTVALAWRVDSNHDLIDEFIGVVRGRTPHSSRTQQSRAVGPAASRPTKAAADSTTGQPLRRGKPRSRG